jgi:predicted AAA+ superfamily ATPase
LTHLELGNQFDLNQALHWGTLPEIFECSTDDEKKQFLMAYAHTYLKEEIGREQFVRNLLPFRKFLEVAAQCNGQILNFAAIARDTHLDEKTVKSYFLLLEDTLLGYMLEPYHGSLRKRVHQKPKFYFFDTGVVRALAQHLTVPLLPSTSAYGYAFEHFFITECMRLSSYYQLEYKFSYVRTVNDQEIDLIIERPNQATFLIEIKSAREVYAEMFKPLQLLKDEFPDAVLLGVSNDPYAKQFGDIKALPWQQAFAYIFDDSGVLSNE